MKSTLNYLIFIIGLLLNFYLQASAAETNDGAILVLGDSWASISQSFLSTVCSLGSNSDDSNQQKPITNNGKAGSTAKQWASGALATESFTKAKYEYDYVWLSIGGNDFNCNQAYHEQIADYILQVIEDIVVASSNDEMRVLYTGYGYPSANICNEVGNTISLFDDLSSTIRNKISKSSYSNRVTVMDVSSMFVTAESSPYSDMKWYADDIHINLAGYEKLFSSKMTQEFFGCTEGGERGEGEGGGGGEEGSSAATSISSLTHIAYLGVLFFSSLSIFNGLI